MKYITSFFVLCWSILACAQPFTFMNMSHASHGIANASASAEAGDDIYVFWQESSGTLNYRFWNGVLWSETILISENPTPFKELTATSVEDTCYLAWIEAGDSSSVFYRKVKQRYVSTAEKLYTSANTIARLKCAHSATRLTFGWLESSMQENQIRVTDIGVPPPQTVASDSIDYGAYTLGYDSEGTLWVFWSGSRLNYRIQKNIDIWSEPGFIPLGGIPGAITELDAQFNSVEKQFEIVFPEPQPTCACSNALLYVAGYDSVWTPIDVIVPRAGSSGIGDISTVSHPSIAISSKGQTTVFLQYQYSFPDPSRDEDKVYMVNRSTKGWDIQNDVFPDSTTLLDVAISSTDSLFCIFLKNGDIYLAGNDRVTDVRRTTVEAIPEGFSLRQNYPNPFNPTTEIRFSLPKTANVKLTVFNVLGKEVKTLFQGRKQAGAFVMAWDGTNNLGVKLSSGIYIYRLEADANGERFVQTRRMLMLK